MKIMEMEKNLRNVQNGSLNLEYIKERSCTLTFVFFFSFPTRLSIKTL